MMTRQIRLAEEFSRFPFGRYPEQGPFNGQRFREEWLVPALAGGGQVEVDLDDARGLSPSFLEEAFGGLVRLGMSAKDVVQRVRIKSDLDPSYIREIMSYVERAAEARAR